MYNKSVHETKQNQQHLASATPITIDLSGVESLKYVTRNAASKTTTGRLTEKRNMLTNENRTAYSKAALNQLNAARMPTAATESTFARENGTFQYFQ